MGPSCWLFSVTPENWEIARKRHIWAVRTENIAQKIKKGDLIVLYVTRIRSFCSILQVVEDWTQAKHAIWTDEINEGKIKYPYQTKATMIMGGLVNTKELVAKLSFVENKQRWGVYFLGAPANLRRPIPESDYRLIHETMKSKPLPADVSTLIKVKPEAKKEEAGKSRKGTSRVPKHNEIRDMILETGKIEGKIAEVEYPIDNLRLDVVWKTITSGNPKWTFEVQMAGNFYEALTKLKHAWDKWNSKPFLVTTDSYEAQAKSLLEGSFHEMKEDARIVNWERIVTLHKCLKEAYEIKMKIRF